MPKGLSSKVAVLPLTVTILSLDSVEIEMFFMEYLT